MRSVLPQFRRNKINITGILTVILAAMAGVVICQETFAQITVYTLSELSAGVPSRLNNLGDVTGKARNSVLGKIGAIIWNHGSLQRRNLGNLAGGEYSSASGINDAGEASGAANIATSIVPFVWRPTGGLQRIALLPGEDSLGREPANIASRYHYIVIPFLVDAFTMLIRQTKPRDLNF